MTGAIQGSGPFLHKRATPITPSFRAASGGPGGGNKTSAALTVPNTAVIGDFAIFVFTVKSSATTIGSPTGPELLEERADASNTGVRAFLYCAWVVDSGDGRIGSPGYVYPNQTLTWTSSNSTPLAIACAVYKDTSGFSTYPASISKPGNTLGSGTKIRFTTIQTEPWRSNDLCILAGGASPVNAANNNANGSSPLTPSGYTSRVINVGQPLLSLTRSAFIFDGPIATSDIDVNTNSGGSNVACNFATWTFALAPATEPASNDAPPSLAGKPLYVYGASGTCAIIPQAPVGYWGYMAEAPYPFRLKRALGCSDDSNHMGAGGMFAPDMAIYAYGQIQVWTQANQTSHLSEFQKGTWADLPDRSNAIVMIDPMGNDWLNSAANPTKRLAGAWQGLHSLVRLLRSDTIVEETDGSVVLTGTWSNTASVNWYSGGSIKTTTTPGDKATIMTSETDIDVVLVGYDDAQGTVGSAFEVWVDGNLYTSGTLSNQCLKPPGTIPELDQSQTLARPHVPVTVPVENMGGGSHTVEVRHTGSSGQALAIDCYLTRSATPPIIVLNKFFDISAKGYTLIGNAVDYDDCTPFNDLLDDVAALYDDGRVLVYDPMESGLWDVDLACSQDGDGLHLSDWGSAFLERELITFLRERFA